LHLRFTDNGTKARQSTGNYDDSSYTQSTSSPPQLKLLDLSSHAVVTGFTVEPSWMDIKEASLVRIHNLAPENVKRG